MFDTFLGLPLHVLVLHFTVVLVPISALATAAVFLRPSWRAVHARRMVAVNVAMLALTFVTVRAGLDLKERYRSIGNNAVPRNDHEALGKTLLWIMVGLVVATTLAWLATRQQGLSESAVLGLGVVVAGLAAASMVVTVLAGHTGSTSHWKEFIDNTGSNAKK